MSDHKKRVEAAMLRYHERDAKEVDKLSGRNKRQKRNMKPEKITEKECLEWMRSEGWEVQVVDSKAIYNKAAGCYTQNTSVKTGNADVQGIMIDGTSVAVELKAKGKLSTFLKDGNEKQRDFIIKRIHMNGFACVVDSVQMLQTIYMQWLDFRTIDKECAKQYLLSCLPVRKAAKPSTKTPANSKDDLGF